MGTTAEKLYKILDSKEEIKQALIAKGINITDETTFAEYAEKINEITNGGAITDEEALLFIKDLAEGKRKIAKAVRSKYETITNEESGITEYSTFEELSNKIADIPITVPMGNAMEQNGGVLPFYDVYNELVKASKQYTEYPYCCAFELDKWNYDNDHKVTLSGADAYLTSDGVYLRSSEVNGEYQFTDQDKPNSNRFVVYFFGSTPYQVPKSLPATSCLGLWCVKGTPLMSFNADFIRLNSINVYDGELVVKEANDFKFLSIALNQKLRLLHIKSISGGSNMIAANTYLSEVSLPNLTTISANDVFYKNTNLREISLPNLTTISGGNIFYNNTNLREISLPNLTTISGGSNIFYSNTALREITLPNLTTISGGNTIFNSNTALREITLPNLTTISSTALGYLIGALPNQHFYSIDLSRLKTTSLGLVVNNIITVDELKLDSLEEFNSRGNVFLTRIEKDEITLPKLHKCTNLIPNSSKIKTLHIGDGMRDGVAGDIKVAYDTLSYFTTLTVANGFKAKLNLTGCNGLSREVIVDILNNLADLTDTEYADKLTLTLGSTLYDRITADDRLIATNKKWQVVK